MPPVGKPRPNEASYDAVVAYLESSLDKAAAAHPNPGRTATIRRLTRTEYRNAVRDLLAVDVDVSSLLPADESSYGFDNVTVGDLSPTLLDRYLSAAGKISRLAVGRPSRAPGGETIRVPADLTQEGHIAGLPIGTRGGTVLEYTFPQDGEYEIQIRLTRDRDEHVEGLSEPHEVELLVDRDRVQVFTVKPPQGEVGHATADQHLKVRTPVRAGPHAVGVAFLKKPSLLPEGARQPYQARFNSYRHPRIQPAIYSVSVIGPYGAAGSGDTPSRRRIFVSRPAGIDDEEQAAKEILSALLRRAYRRPLTEADLGGPLALYRKARAEDDFDAGIEMAVAAVLVSPHFLFRVETDPAGIPPRHPVSGQRPRAGVAALLLSLEQHPGRRAARRRGEAPAARAGSARTPGPPDARRSTLAVARDQLRGAVAAPPQPRLDHAGHAAVPGLRRQPAPGVSPGDGALLRERAPRRPQRARICFAPTTRS